MPSRGQYWKKGGLIDETVKEEDLSQALQTKVNSGGGGGGTGSSPDLDTAVMFDEFVYLVNSGVTDKYNVTGTFDTAFGEITSMIALRSIAGIGNGGEIETNDSWLMDSLNTPADFDGEAVIVPASPLADQIIFFGYITGFGNNLNGASTEAGVISAVPDAFGFIFDPSISANWRLISFVGGTSTTIQTSIPVVLSDLFKLKVVFTASTPSLEFFINDVSQGTITTNISTGFLYLNLYCGAKTVATTEILLDYWRATSPRKATI